MKIDIEGLFQNRPPAEIIEVSSKEREKILKNAEHFMVEMLLPSRRVLNGGNLTTVDLAMTRSLLEVFVRNEALKESNNPIVDIDAKIYDKALESFKKYIKSMMLCNPN